MRYAGERVSVREAKVRLSELLVRVEAGEEITITRSSQRARPEAHIMMHLRTYL